VPGPAGAVRRALHTYRMSDEIVTMR
jgi:hypothetical protein